MSKEKQHQESINNYISTLENASDEEFQSFKYVNSNQGFSINLNFYDPKFIPNKYEALTHLKLLRSFQTMKSKLVSASNDKEYNIKLWQVFVTNAVQRFIKFVTCLKAKYGTLGENVTEESLFTEGTYLDITFLSVLETLLPPLDVIMVWHSFLLNPSSMYDIFVREEFLKFAFLPLPLHLLNRYIDNYTFEYEIPTQMQDNYKNLINDSNEVYDIVKSFSMYENLVQLYCPKCQTQLSNQFPLSTDSNNGFADSDFNIKNINYKPGGDCFHNDIEVLTHDRLRALQLYADVFRTGPLQGTFKYFSKILCAPRYYKRDPMEISELTKRDIIENWDNVKHLPMNEMVNQILKKSRHIRNQNRDAIYLKLYVQFNLISHTIKDSIEVGEDLVGCVLRQERFVESMNLYNWLQSPFVMDSLNESITRYTNFFNLLTDLNHHMLVPTLDIDVIWHTHQLTLFGYFKDCKHSPCQTVIDHNDKIEENKLDTGFQHTAKLYKLKFKQNYSLCFCWYCVSKRNGKKEIFKLIFRKKKDKDQEEYLSSSLVNDLDLENLTHISGHNAIIKPKDSKHETNIRLPWTTDPKFSFYTNPAIFIVPPVFPISCNFIGQQGSCTSVQASCTTQNGFCLAIGKSCGGMPSDYGTPSSGGFVLAGATVGAGFGPAS